MSALLALPIVLPIIGAAAAILVGRLKALQRAISIAVLSANVVLAGLLLMRVRAVQERGVDFDGRDVFSGDERQLDDAENCGTGNGKPGSAGSTCTVDDADEGRRDGSGQTAARHGESVDLAENLG